MTPEYAIQAAINSVNPGDHSTLCKLECITYAPDYAEHGYTLDGDKGIFFANWNPSSFDKDAPKHERIMIRLRDILERMGATLEWSDEWATCDDCNKAFRISGDSYGWMQYGWISESGDCICGNCVIASPDDYVESLINNHRRANLFSAIDLTKYGFTLAGDKFENGFHRDQNDRPIDIAKGLSDSVNYIFQIDGVGQFDCEFSVFVRPKSLGDYAEPDYSVSCDGCAVLVICHEYGCPEKDEDEDEDGIES